MKNKIDKQAFQAHFFFPEKVYDMVDAKKKKREKQPEAQRMHLVYKRYRSTNKTVKISK